MAQELRTTMLLALGAAGLLAFAAGTARADSTLTIATVNNGDMVVMQKLPPTSSRSTRTYT